MPGTPATANLTAGREAPDTGIYVVSQVPHEVLIAGGMVLPKYCVCMDVRFSLRMLATRPIEENEFFK
jgi:hypothetical protein